MTSLTRTLSTRFTRTLSTRFTRTLLSPTALALALTTALAPLAAADRIAPSRKPVAPIRNPSYVPVTADHGMHFAQPPGATTAEGEASMPAPVAPMPTEPEMLYPPTVVTKATVRAALEDARANSLAAFKNYMDSRSYPSNTWTNGALNVWRDDDGHFCAAATIIRVSGRIAISEGVADTDNNLRLITVKDGALMDWILTSGLTQQEINLIQRPFMGVRPDRPAPSVVTIDQRKRAAETQRLVKAYTSIYAQLVKTNKASLEVAVNRLMAHPQLAREFLDGTLAARDIH